MGGGHGGGDAKTIISPNTSFGDIIITHIFLIALPWQINYYP